MKSAVLVSSVIGVLVILLAAGWWYRSLAPTTSLEAESTPLADESTESLEAEEGGVTFGDDMIESVAPLPATSGMNDDVTSDESTAVKVSITDTGFLPATMTVPVNTTVTFTNNGQGAHWLASDPHPTHTAQAGFDAKRGLATGEAYTFTFTASGTWGYHDHLNPRVTGTIVVK